mgnify:CR=1 FL=1
MIKTSKLILIRHAPVKTEVGFFPDNDPDAIIDELKIKKLAGYIPEDCLWYVSPLKRTVQTANALSKYVNVKEMKFDIIPLLTSINSKKSFVNKIDAESFVDAA